MRAHFSLPVFLPPGSPVWFPDACDADAEGLVAVGGDLSPERVLHAYERGIFPWFDDEVPPLWWSPDPRVVVPVDAVHVSRRLARRLRQGRFRFTWDTAFREVMVACGETRPEGTWIVKQVLDAYVLLHHMGHAHSLEVWNGTTLVGGIYGVHRGGLFSGESMFHRETDASKAALVACVRSVARAGIKLFDVQMMTSHLESMGAVPMPRELYLAEVERIRSDAVDLSDLDLLWELPA
jgi:leucyl/phenylalanyl-tRNA--protein transferase